MTGAKIKDGWITAETLVSIDDILTTASDGDMASIIEEYVSRTCWRDSRSDGNLIMMIKKFASEEFILNSLSFEAIEKYYLELKEALNKE